MKAKTELLLYHLLWAADGFIRPSFRNISQSFETWAYRNGYARQIALLERQKFIKVRGGDSRVYSLTKAGRLQALGGRDPVAQWQRPWDGYWRIVLFDVPVRRDADRLKLRRYLRKRGFGCLQNSVWITPDRLRPEMRLTKLNRGDVEMLLMLEARPCAGETDAELVKGAWDFHRINSGYKEYLQILRGRKKARGGLEAWTKAEGEAWQNASQLDPFLPRCLLPKGYLGEIAWKQRLRASKDVGRAFDRVAALAPTIR